MCLAIDCNHGVTRRGALKAAAGFAVAANLSSAHAKEEGAGQPKPNAIGADAALYRLMAGNVRYVANKPKYRDFSAGRAERVSSQFPIAAVLSCADSRVAPEFAFDQGPGDLFVVRLAGNFANDDGLATLEYAVKYLDVPLVLVFGHSNCGAVAAAIKMLTDNAALPGHLPGLVHSIKPASKPRKRSHQRIFSRLRSRKMSRLERFPITWNRVIEKESLNFKELEHVPKKSCNVFGTCSNVQRLETAQPLLAHFAQTKQVKIVGGIYDLANGKIGLLS